MLDDCVTRDDVSFVIREMIKGVVEVLSGNGIPDTPVVTT